MKKITLRIGTIFTAAVMIFNMFGFSPDKSSEDKNFEVIVADGNRDEDVPISG